MSVSGRKRKSKGAEKWTTAFEKGKSADRDRDRVALESGSNGCKKRREGNRKGGYFYYCSRSGKSEWHDPTITSEGIKR